MRSDSVQMKHSLRSTFFFFFLGIATAAVRSLRIVAALETFDMLDPIGREVVGADDTVPSFKDGGTTLPSTLGRSCRSEDMVAG